MGFFGAFAAANELPALGFLVLPLFGLLLVFVSSTDDRLFPRRRIYSDRLAFMATQYAVFSARFKLAYAGRSGTEGVSL